MLDIGVNHIGILEDGCHDVLGNVGEGLAGLVALIAPDFNHLGEPRLRILLVIGDGDAGGQRTPVKVGGTERGGHRGGELIEFARLDVVYDAGEDLLGEGVRIHSEGLGSLADSL